MFLAIPTINIKIFPQWVFVPVRKSTLTQGSDGIYSQTQGAPKDNETAIHKYFNGNKTDQPDTTPNLELPNIFSSSGVLNQISPFKHHKNSPLISPSSIPYPNPSTSTKQSESNSYPTYGGYLYSIPGYSAFQPIQYPMSLIGQNSGESAPIVTLSQPPLSKDIIQLTTCSNKDSKTEIAEDYNELNSKLIEDNDAHTKMSVGDLTKFVMSQPDPKPSIEYTSLSKVKQNEDTASSVSGSQAIKDKYLDDNQAVHKVKHKPTERFSLKTSIPISKIDIKCVSNATELQHFNFSPFRDLTETKPTLSKIVNMKDAAQKVKIQSNILIKSGSNNSDSDTKTGGIPNIQNSLSGLNHFSPITNESNDINFWQDCSKDDHVKDIASDTIPLIASQGKIIIGGTLPRMQKAVLPTKHGPESSTLSKTILQTSLERKDPDDKNKLVFLPNRSLGSQQLMLTISQQPAPKKPKMLDPKNLMAPSRLLGALRKGKEGLQTLEGHQQTGKVVALKRLHQDNGDENDFENLITENQIYGNKIVVKEKSQGTVLQERDIGRKNIEDAFDAFSEPNFLYLSNMSLQPENTKNSNFDYGNYCFKKDCPDLDQNIISAESFRFRVKNFDHYQINKDFMNHSNGDGTKLDETENKMPFSKTHLLYQVPLIIESDTPKTHCKFGGKNHFNTELAALLSAKVKNVYNDILDSGSNDGLMFTCAIQNPEKNGQPKIIFANMRPNHIPKTEALSSIDLAEKRRRIKRLKHLSNLHSGKDSSNKLNENAWSDDGVLTACGIKREIEKEFFRSKMRDESSQSESDSEGDSILDVSLSLRPAYLDTGQGKVDFLKKFGLVTHKEKSDIEVNLLEKSIEHDRIIKACLSIGHMEYVLKTEDTYPVRKLNYKLPLPRLKEDFERKEAVTDDKMCFMFGLELNRVSQQHKDDYEDAWCRIISDRKRRRGESTFTKYCEDWHRMYFSEPRQTLDRHARGQLKRMTEIKKTVSETNNLIKMRLDSLIDCRSCNSSDIPMLAERNFTEITKLSNMANSSLKFMERKQNLQEDESKPCPAHQGSNGVIKNESYPGIKIPDIGKIIALQSTEDFCVMDTSPPISMDEPGGSAALTKFDLSSSDSSMDAMEISIANVALKNEVCRSSVGTEFSGFSSWPGINAIEECYRRYDTACQSETLALRSENIRLQKEIQKKRIEMSTLNDNIGQHLAEKKASEKQANSLMNLLDKLRVCMKLLKGAGKCYG